MLNLHLQKILSLITLISLLMFSFSSCSLNSQSDFESLLRPPNLNKEQKEIQNALQKSTVSPLFLLQFPKSGDFRQSFIKADFNNNGTTQYVAFYRPKGEGTSIHINLLSKIKQNDNEAWISTFDAECSGTQINTVSLEKLTNDDTTLLVTTWNLNNTKEKGLIVYQMIDNSLKEIFNTTFTEMSLADLNGDNINDIFLINQTPATDTKPATTTASLYSLLNYNGIKLSSCQMDPATTSFASVKIGKIDSTPAIFVDSFKTANTMSTEIIYYEDGGRTEYGSLIHLLLNPLYDTTKNTVDASVRESNYSIISTDIDNDGNTEFPSSTELPGYHDKPSSEKMFLTTWNSFSKYNEKNIYPQFDCVYNNNYNYYLIIPDQLKSNFTVDSINNSATLIFKYSSLQEDTSLVPAAKDAKSSVVYSEIFSIRIFTADTWHSPNNDFYYKLSQNDKYIYGIKFSELAATLNLNLESVSKYFKYIT